MELQTLWKGKGKSVQRFTKEYRKKYLALNIPLHTQETLLKYIGSLHSYIHNTIILLATG